MNYLISPPEKTDLKIEPAQLINALKAEWANIDIQTLDNPERAYSLSFRIPLTNGILDGSLERTGQCFVLEGDVRDCAKFALWLRSQLDSKHKLLFYDEAYSADVELGSETTVHEIIKCFMSLQEELDMTTITLRLPENVVNSMKA